LEYWPIPFGVLQTCCKIQKCKKIFLLCLRNPCENTFWRNRGNKARKEQREQKSKKKTKTERGRTKTRKKTVGTSERQNVRKRKQEEQEKEGIKRSFAQHLQVLVQSR